MSKLIYLIGKSFAHIFKRPLALASSFLSILLLFLMLELVWVTYLTGEKYFNDLIAQINMEVFFNDDLQEKNITDLVTTINSINGVESLVYLNKDDARDKLFSLMGTDLLEGMDNNPLPRSAIIGFEPGFVSSKSMNDFTDRIMEMDGIDEIYYPQQWLESTEYSKSFMIKLEVFLAIVIALGIILNMLHTVRISIRAYYEEVRQMQLIGAGRNSLSFPYIFEGLFYGLVSSAAGWGIIYYMARNITFREIQTVIPNEIGIFIFCGAATLIGMLVSYIAIRRVLE